MGHGLCYVGSIKVFTMPCYQNVVRSDSSTASSCSSGSSVLLGFGFVLKKSCCYQPKAAQAFSDVMSMVQL